MGRRIDGFDIQLKFDAKGQVISASYLDGEGCGASKLVPLDTTVQALINHHLLHYKSSHGMEPPKYCGHIVESEGLAYQCWLEPHPGTPNNHTFTIKH